MNRIAAQAPEGAPCLQDSLVVNGAALLLDDQDPNATALICRDADGRELFTFAEVRTLSGALATDLALAGVRRGDVVLTLIGSRAEWVLSMLACMHLGAVVLPCVEQLRADDLASRIEGTRPAAILTAARNRAVVDAAARRAHAGVAPPVLEPSVRALRRTAASGREVAVRRDDLRPSDPLLITFTSGTSGPPKPVVHGLKYLEGQRLQAEHWLGARAGELVWCTAAPGWSKSARNAFIAPWLSGAAALLHDARFDPEERIAVLHQEQPQVLCMAPTEYRLLAKHTELTLPRSLRRLVAAGEALNPAVLERWREASGLAVRDGYGQTETGQLTAPPLGEDPLPGSMGRPLPGVALDLDGDELVITDPASVPTFFVGYLEPGRGRIVPHDGVWHTGDRVRRDDDGNLFFIGRTDDVIVSSGYRIGPFEVESVLVEHPAVAEAAAVAAPDAERGSVVRAVVVLRPGIAPGPELAAELQAHVRERTAPYKYPRIIDFVDALPKTPSGKIRRTMLRGD